MYSEKTIYFGYEKLQLEFQSYLALRYVTLNILLNLAFFGHLEHVDNIFTPQNYVIHLSVYMYIFRMIPTKTNTRVRTLFEIRYPPV